MPASHVDHDRNGPSRVRKRDVIAQLEQRRNGPSLLGLRELFEWTRQMATSTLDCSPAGAVVPIGRREETGVRSEPDEELLDQQSVVEKDDLVGHLSALLVEQVGVVDRSETRLVSLLQHTV